VAVIKNIHEHQIDKKGKDSYKFMQLGAKYCVLKSKINHETTIFLKEEMEWEVLIDWISKGPFKIDLIFTENFRSLDYPAILCLKNPNEFKEQVTPNVKAVSGIFLLKKEVSEEGISLPKIELPEQFKEFLEIFNILPN